MDLSPSIRDLQQMLRQLSERYPAIPRLAATGVFDELTLEAVMVFQRDFYPPVTGVVNEATWYAIVDAYLRDILHFGEPSLLRVLPNGRFASGQGESSYPLLIAEAIFAALSQELDNFMRSPATGTNTGVIHENLRALQRLTDLPADGVLNRATWEFLSRLYHIFITRAPFVTSETSLL